jgi:hypothetical protein
LVDRSLRGVESSFSNLWTERANPGKPGDAKLRAYPVVDGTAAGPPK